MVTEVPASTRAVGFWSAVLATVFSIAYDVAQVAEWLGWLGSRGGPESSSTPFGLVVLLTPSLFLGASFLALVVSVHEVTPPERRVWSRAAAAFATVYAVLISLNYFVQLTWVAPRLARGQTQGIESFLFVPFDSFLYSVDILGYSFMSLATLFAARAFTGGGLERVVRAFLTANGLLLPFIALQMYAHWLIWIAALWAVTFPGSTWSLAVLFRRAGSGVRVAAPGGDPDPGRTVAEVKAADAAWAGAAATKSVERMVDFYDPGGVFIGQDGKVVAGREALRAAWVAFFATPGIELTWQVREVSASKSRDMAVSYGPWQIEQGPPGQKTRRTGTYVFVWRKQADGKWKVLVDKP